jgi:hypothetical protein
MDTPHPMLGCTLIARAALAATLVCAPRCGELAQRRRGRRWRAHHFHLHQKIYINGVLRWTINNSTKSPVSQRSEFIILSSEVSNGSWAGTVPAAGYGGFSHGAWISVLNKVVP